MLKHNRVMQTKRSCEDVAFPWRRTRHCGHVPLTTSGTGHAPQVLSVLMSSSTPGFHPPSSCPSSSSSESGTQLAGTNISIPRVLLFVAPKDQFSMSEKAPLIPIAAPAERSPRVQRCTKGRAIGRVLTTAAAVGLIYCGMPYGMSWTTTMKLAQKCQNLLTYIASESVSESKSELCLTPACVHAASELLYNLSPNYKELDPCDNFEELVCGGWRDRHDLRSDQGDAFTGTIMSEQSQLLLRHILEAPYPKDSQHSSFSPMQLMAVEKSADEKNFDKMKTAYDACLNEDQIKHNGAKPLLEVMGQIKKVYPVTRQGSDAHDLKDTILLLAELGITSMVAVGTGADDTDPDSVVVSVAAPYSFGLPSKERYLDSKLVEQYRDVAVNVLSALYPKQDVDSFGKVIDLEKKLAAASPDSEDRDDVTVGYSS
jgi:endothelin-converting enzyme